MKKKDDEFLKNIEAKLKRGSKKPNGKQSKKKPELGKPGQGINRFTFFLFITLLVFTFILLQRGSGDKDGVELPYTSFVEKVENDEIAEVLVVNDSIIEFAIDGIAYSTRIPYMDVDLVNRLLDSKVVVKSEIREDSKFFVILMQWLPWIILMGFFWFIISRQMRGRGNEAFSFGKSKAQMVNSTDIKERFEDVKGCEEAISELRDVVSFLRDPSRFAMLGAHIPKGVLLVGSPGTGKTLLAKAVAGEAGVPFFSMSGSDFVEMFVGVGASRVRDLFTNGKKHAPCIIFVDEIDAVGRTRGAGYGGGHDEREQTLNQLLVEMDGFGTESGIILIAATNRPDVLDKALLRPGRFDRQVVVDIPDMKGRRAILEVHARRIKLADKVDFTALARGTAGFTGADLANIINEAALLAAKEGKAKVNNTHLELSKDKVMLGSEKRSMYISPEEKANTAYHEAGHALISMLIKKGNALHKVSIIPRGRALGLTYFLPEDGKLTMRKSFLEAELRVLYGGRVAEEIIFKDVTNGAMNDIERATSIAKSMVCEWGLSKLGAIAYRESKNSMYLPSAPNRENALAHSEEMTKKIDGEVKRILDEAYLETKTLLKRNVSKLKKLAEELLQKETLSDSEVYKLLGMKQRPRPNY